MFILTQDRNKYIKLEDFLHIVENSVDGICMGFNLMINDDLLGTFDTMCEALEEVCSIRDYNDIGAEVYEISGYSIGGFNIE